MFIFMSDPQAQTTPVSLGAGSDPAKVNLTTALVNQIGALMIIRSPISHGQISQYYHEMLKCYFTYAHVILLLVWHLLKSLIMIDI